MADHGQSHKLPATVSAGMALLGASNLAMAYNSRTASAGKLFDTVTYCEKIIRCGGERSAIKNVYHNITHYNYKGELK